MDLQFIEMGKRIQLRRKELHMKQNELAEILNISTNHMSSIETGKEKPSLTVFIHICNILKVTPNYLLLGNMHANNVPQDIIDGLKLCTKEDIALIRHILEFQINKNHKENKNEHHPL